MSHFEPDKERMAIAAGMMELYDIPADAYQQQEFIARHLSSQEILAWKAKHPIDKVSEK